METWIQFIDPAEETIINTEQSSHYNEKHPNQTYIRKTQADGFYREITVINGGGKGKTKPVNVEKLTLYSVLNDEYLPADQAEGLRITAGDKEYILFLCHQEVMTPTDILKWKNCLGHGKAVLFDRSSEKNDTVIGEILAW